VCRGLCSIWKISFENISTENIKMWHIQTLQRAIKKFSTWLSSVQNKIKIVSASYSSKAQNTTCAMWLFGYKYFVHSSIWTKCLSDDVENANTRTAQVSEELRKRYRCDPAKIYFTTCYSGWNVDLPLWFWARTTKHAMEQTNQWKLSFHYAA